MDARVPLAADAGAPVAGARGKALVVDDDSTNLMFLRTLLKREGFEVVEARDGIEAVQRFREERPDIIFMDVMMPRMDGYEATRQIKALAGDSFVPVIFLTALTDEQALDRCIQVGGDDFLTKPCKQSTLKSKIASMERIRGLYRRVQRQHDELQGLHARRVRDDAVAQRIFSAALAGNSAVPGGWRSLLRPASTFNGDLFLVSARPGGGWNLLLGDFTGHGLAAAIGALPVADVFRSMTAKGFGPADILAQINHKLHALLPRDMFLSACFLCLDREGQSVEVWNGGMPDVLVVSGGGRIRQRIRSQHLPLGILRDGTGGGFERLVVAAGDRLVLYSDGLIEARNAAGEEFGEERLVAVVQEASGVEPVCEHVERALEEFCQECMPDDDISLVDIPVHVETAGVASAAAAATHPVAVAPVAAASWQWGLTLHADGLKRVDPLPLVMSQLQELAGLGRCYADLYTVLAELYTNALHHGVLGLDSAIKRSADGFEQYYRLRDEWLQNLRTGTVSLTLEYFASPPGGRLHIRVEDSGSGFDPQPYLDWRPDGQALSGRGIGLVQSLCESLVYRGVGNCVEAVYAWPA